MEQDQIKEIESRYNHLKAITASDTEEEAIREKAMEERISIENECFIAGYRFVSRGFGIGSYLKQSSSTVVIVSWQSAAMPVQSHFAYHATCYTGSSLPAQEVREVPIEQVSVTAVCCECWRKIREEGK